MAASRASTSGLQLNSGSELRNTLSYTVPAGSNASFTVSFNPTAVQAYNGNITITHNTAGSSRTIALTGRGGKPVISYTPGPFNANLAIGSSSTQTLNVSNSGNLPLNYSFSASEAPAWLSFNGSSSASGIIAVGGASVDITLGFNAAGLTPGSYSATINGSSNDPTQTVITLSANLEVYDPNHAPVIDLPDSFSIAKNGTLPQDLSSYVSDADADELWLSCVEPTHIGVEINGLSATFTPATDWTGSESVQFTVHDGTTESTDAISITVTNTTPVINLPEYLSFNRNATLDMDFSGYVSDANGDPLSLGFSGNTGIIISVDGLDVHFDHTPGFAGSETITFSVFDGTAYSEDTVIVTVNNQGPAIELPLSFNANENTPLPCDFTAYVSDPNNDPLTLSYSGNVNVAVLIEGMNVTFSPAAGWFGTEDIVITVSDGDLQANAVAHIVVSHVVLSLETPVVTISEVSGNRLLQWNSIEDADEYWVYRATDPEGSYSLIANTTNLNYLDEDALDKAFYYVKAVYLGE